MDLVANLWFANLKEVCNLFMNFFKHQSGSCVAVNGGTEITPISLKRSLFVFQI